MSETDNNNDIDYSKFGTFKDFFDQKREATIQALVINKDHYWKNTGVITSQFLNCLQTYALYHGVPNATLIETFYPFSPDILNTGIEVQIGYNAFVNFGWIISNLWVSGKWFRNFRGKKRNSEEKPEVGSGKEK